MRKLHNQFLAALAALGFAVFGIAQPSVAAGYPERAITIIVPTGPGSLVDILARLVGDGMRETWGQQIVVKNIGGAGGSIGAAKLAEAPNDGYTLGFIPANLTTHPYLYDIGYDVKKDFTPIIRVAGASMVFYVSNEVPANSVTEFIELAKAQPGKVTFATAGKGSVAHLAAELFATATDLDLKEVAYKKLNLGVLDVVSGRVSSVFVSAAQGMPFVQDNKLKALGITGVTPNPGAPGIEPIADQGVPGYEIRSWFGFMAPAGVPAEIIDTIREEVTRQAQTEAFTAALGKAGLEPIVGSSEEFEGVIDAELVKWADILGKPNG